MSNESKTDECDVAIVGGGIAGLYAAYRLRQAWLGLSGDPDSHQKLAERLKVDENKPLKVILFERDPVRLGGRLRSVELPFAGGGVLAELGAMRFALRQKLLRRLLSDLKVRTVPFGDQEFSTQFYLRGRHFDARNIARNDYPTRFPYRLEPSEGRKGPDDLVGLVLDDALRELTLARDAPTEALLALEKLRAHLSKAELTDPEWALIQEHGRLLGKVPLANIGMWNLIHHYLSLDAALLVEDGFGYDSIVGNWNVSDAIPWFLADFAPGQSFETVVGSFTEVIECLRTRLKTTKTTKDHTFEFEFVAELNASMNALKGQDGRCLVIGKPTHNEYASADALIARYEKQTNGFSVSAKAVILALPKDPLKKIDVSGIVTGDNKDEWDRTLETVRPHRLVKMALGFREAWWRDERVPKGSVGRIFTDLPLRQIYYFDRQWLETRGRYRYYDSKGDLIEKPSDQEPEIKGMVIAYLDGRRSSFWRSILAVTSPTAGSSDGTNNAGVIANELAKFTDNEMWERSLLGERICGWQEPEELLDLVSRLIKDRTDKQARFEYEKWTASNQARFGYFYRDGLHQRVADKLSHMLKACHKAAVRDETPFTIPGPVAGAYAMWDSWGKDPEAGWHTWEPGIKSRAVMAFIAQPFREGDSDLNVFVCGEAYSSEQGWIEGALKSVEIAMDRLGISIQDDIRDYLGLPPVGGQMANGRLFRDAVQVPLSDHRDLVFLSGKIGFDPGSPATRPSIEGQTSSALNKLIGELEKLGGTRNDFVVIRAFLTSMDHYEKFNDAYLEEVKQFDDPPTRTTIAVRALPAGALIELDAIAVLKAAKS